MVELFPNIFVVTSESGAANLGFIIGKKGVVVIDTSLFVSKAKELKDYISSLTKKPIILVFNTHYHPDHSFGNSAFDSPVIAHEITKLKMEKIDKAYIEDIRRKIGTEAAKEFENFQIKLPTYTFKKKKKVDLGDRRINFVHLGGHTEDSSIAIVEPEAIVFCGDIVVNGYHPEIVEDSNLDNWIKALKKLMHYEEISYVIPGHGKIGNKKSIEDMLEYMMILKDFVVNYKKRDFKVFLDQLSENNNFSNRRFPELLFNDLKILLRMEGESKKLRGG